VRERESKCCLQISLLGQVELHLLPQLHPLNNITRAAYMVKKKRLCLLFTGCLFIRRQYTLHADQYIIFVF
jgi:hypothetical protein